MLNMCNEEAITSARENLNRERERRQAPGAPSPWKQAKKQAGSWPAASAGAAEVCIYDLSHQLDLPKKAGPCARGTTCRNHPQGHVKQVKEKANKAALEATVMKALSKTNPKLMNEMIDCSDQNCVLVSRIRYFVWVHAVA